MPILQSRMISVIEAGRDYQQALTKAIDQAERLASQVKGHSISPEDGFWRLYGLLNVFTLMNYPMDSNTTLELEHKHFRKAARANALRALKKQQERPTTDGGFTRRQTGGITQHDEYLAAKGGVPVYQVSEAEKDHAKMYKEALAAQMEREAKFARGEDEDTPHEELPEAIGPGPTVRIIPNSGEVPKTEWAKAQLAAEDAALGNLFGGKEK